LNKLVCLIAKLTMYIIKLKRRKLAKIFSKAKKMIRFFLISSKEIKL